MTRRLGRKAFVLAWLAIDATCAFGQFLDVSKSAGVKPYWMANGMGGGIAAADYDNDGDIDLFVPNGIGARDQLYRNRGDGTFDEIAAKVGLANHSNNRAALWFDADGDGRLDLVAANDCFGIECADSSVLRLYHQTPTGAFVDMTAESGLTLPREPVVLPHVGGLAAGDLDNDGFLDLVVCHWRGPIVIYRNDGLGGFENISVSSKIGGINYYWTPIIFDFNRDGWLDLFLAIDFGPNQLWLNLADGTFVNMAGPAGVNNAWNDMGVALGDYDNDGDFDLYITEVENPQAGRHNVLYRNDSVGEDLSFVDVAIEAGVDHGYWGWGTTFFDADLDARLDLIATNGFDADNWRHDPTRFFHNLGGASPMFEERATLLGLDDDDYGSCMIAVDLDRDGDLDLAQTCDLGGPLRVMKNMQIEQSGGTWLNVLPRQPGTNHQAIGAVVRVVSRDGMQSRAITAGGSFMGQQPAEAHFGLNGANRAKLVIVEWPDGSVTRLRRVPANQTLVVTPK